ncbi:efflux RND transporter periplasmic adaptor subunit [Sulfuriflexus sp.]|uniref:efflux RND transporter periplasmic adaptor subunit n=1 Tax=Sulfuriflexus sp. TaxID=2015443 RepID=UPI0028CE9B4F|nr:efflux RND transporter periplasmic adaptor subunit [Sulfuriflexus sp.]MDT8403686.1 efflux RND transporter periplasmic adaptor subunit [Sulfuriflexus sp.]
MTRTTTLPPFLWLLVAIGLVLLSACADETTAKKTGTRPAQLVELAPARAETVRHSSRRTGTLHARTEVKLFNQEEGVLTELPFHEGARVKKDDVVVRIDDKLLRAELDKAHATRRQAEEDLARLKQLRSKRLVAEDALARAHTALDVAKAEESLLQTRFSYTRMHAPIDGVISQRFAEPGLVAQRHTHLLTLIDTSTLITEVAVSELLLPGLRNGDDVEVTIDALPNQRFWGKILRIHPSLNAATRTGIVEIVLDPAPAGALPGQFCRVTLQGPPQTRLLVPFSALRRDAEGEFVFVVDNKDKTVRTAVRSGLRIEDKVEILEGLEEGQRLVVKGFLGLKPGSPVRTAADSPVGQKSTRE